MTESETSRALYITRATSKAIGAAIGGPPHAEKAAAMAPHQWTLQWLGRERLLTDPSTAGEATFKKYQVAECLILNHC
jgi:hypothetical protein